MRKVHKRLLAIILSAILLAESSATLLAEGISESVMEKEYVSEAMTETEADYGSDASSGSETGFEELEEQLRAIENGEYSSAPAFNGDNPLSDSQPEEMTQAGSGSDTYDEKIITEEVILEQEPQITGNWKYQLDDLQHAHLVSYLKTEAESVTVPIKLNGHLVTSIESGAFSECLSLQRIRIPFYVADIAEDAFSTKAVIRAYHGTKAMDFAMTYQHPFENLSRYDFADKVIDLTEISRESYHVSEDYQIEFSREEAAYITAGDYFFLPETPRIASGDVFLALSKEDKDSTSVFNC